MATALVATPLLPYFDLANIVMLFLLDRRAGRGALGRGPAVLATFVSVAAFDFFFVPPRLSFAVSDVQYLVTFAVMLAVGLITAQLTAGLRFQARVASHRERVRARCSSSPATCPGPLQTEQVVEIDAALPSAAPSVQGATLLLPDSDGRLQLADRRRTRPRRR